jgi:rhodanese-related sulfurtransferase
VDFFNHLRNCSKLLLKKLIENSYEINDLRFITPRKAYLILCDDVLLIDLRPLSESTFKQARVNRLLLLPYTEFAERKNEIPRDRPVVIGDAVGIQTKIICKTLIDEGYTNIFALAGGFVDWERDGMPMAEDVNQRLSGVCVCQLKPRERK